MQVDWGEDFTFLMTNFDIVDSPLSHVGQYNIIRRINIGSVVISSSSLTHLIILFYKASILIYNNEGSKFTMFGTPDALYTLYNTQKDRNRTPYTSQTLK